MTSAIDYLEELDELLLDQGEDCMLLSQLDGFLTGVLVSPDLVPPSRWLKSVWAGEDGVGVPAFENAADLQHFIDLVMRHYHAIFGALGRPGSYQPVFEIDTNSDEILWEMWVEGFSGNGTGTRRLAAGTRNRGRWLPGGDRGPAHAGCDRNAE